MRLNHIKALIEVDLLQSNRQMANNNRAEKASKKRIFNWRMLLQNVAVIFIFVLLFGGDNAF